MTPAKPELISFKLCPYVQRAVILLKEKQVDFDITYIDLANKPDWFLKISPFGKVPVLRLGEEVLFESAVICEFLDETNPPSHHPQDAVQRAKNRAWMEFGSSLFMLNFQLSMVPDQAAFEAKLAELEKALGRLEEQVTQTPYFNGEKFCIIDASMAPFFQRWFLLEKQIKLTLMSKFPRLKAWGERLMQLDSVKNSVVPEFNGLYVSYLVGKDSSHLSKLLA